MTPEIVSASQDTTANSRAFVPTVAVPPKIEVQDFLEKIHAQLREAPAAALPNQSIKIELRAHEVGYFYATLKRLKAAEAREQRAYYKRFPSLDALVDKEQKRDPKSDPKPFITEPPGQSNPDYAFEQTRLKEALRELPTKLKKMAEALVEADGNVSELARRLGQPQRKTARQVEKIRQHLRDKDLESLDF